MSTEEQLTQLQKDFDELKRQFQFHVHSGLDSQVIPGIPSGLANAPQPSIPAPTGGTTIDSASRGTINTIISTLVTLGLIKQ